MFEKIFHLKENHTDVKTEVMAGITTFMTMAYILAVNPSILSASGPRLFSARFPAAPAGQVTVGGGPPGFP